MIHLDDAGISHARIFGHLSARVNKRMADLLICGIRSEPPVTHEFFPLSRGRSIFSGSICGCSASAKSPLIFSTNKTLNRRATRLQFVSGHALLILRIIFFFLLRGGNRVTLGAICVSLWCVSSVQFVCVCTPVDVRQLTCAGGCLRICAHVRVRAQKPCSCTRVYLRARACVCVGRWSREPKLSFFEIISAE